ncbi:MAG TPA: xanthine dehydrogenase small subunit [Aestuariivirga sp.]|nr:xanthine dehydrogenase small subunit [Aestuariivirga sp.]
MARQAIRFLRRGQVVELSSLPPTRTLLDYLRLEEKSKGTKEGCNEGDCGACTVALGSLEEGRVVYEPVNACILLLGQIDGKELVTVDDLAAGGKLHPVQKAFVDNHASQCGFCTPGFVMSLFTLYHTGRKPTRQEIVDHIAGNLCRCTGYRPIVDAAVKSCTGKPADAWVAAAGATAVQLAALDDAADIFVGDTSTFFAAPYHEEELTRLYADHPDATIVAGATDVGLWVTKQLRTLPKIIHIGRTRGLDRITDEGPHISIGATATYSSAEAFLASIDPDIGEVIRRIGATQVRASGTIGGNIANGSPIGDTPPMLIALGATLHLRWESRERFLPLEDFFVAYGKQDRAAGELVWRVDVPRLKANEAFRAFKLSKRFDQDISAVMGAFKFTLEGRTIQSARIAFGGMAATPKRALIAEAALRGISLDAPKAWEQAISAMAEDYQPIGDMRASAEYRLASAQALLRKALVEVASGQSAATRLAGLRGEAA